MRHELYITGTLCFAKKQVVKEEVTQGDEEVTTVHHDQRELSVLGKHCLATGVKHTIEL